MEMKFWDFHPGFYSRLVKFYLPLLIVGGLGIAVSVYKATPSAQAAPVNHSTKVVYSQSYSAPAVQPVASSLTNTACQSDTGFALAGPITPSSSQTGLVEQFDPIYGHSMFGATATQLADQSRRCPLVIPGDNVPYINAYTSYWIGWRFDYTPGDDGLCRVSSVSVPVHIRQALPVWRDQAQASPQLASAWQAYLAAVKAHEDGHTQLVLQYSNQILAGLQALAPTDCGSIEQAANSLGNSYLSQLKAADSAYEAATQNGAAQGAIVP